METREIRDLQDKETFDGVFTRLFRVRVPQDALIPVDEVRQFGTPISGWAPIDQQMREQKIETFFTIAQMATAHSRGFSLAVIKYEETKVIYGLASAYLQMWRDKIGERYHTRNVPLQDLANLDLFASTVYGKAKYVLNHDFISRQFSQGMDEIFAASALFAVDSLRDTRPTIFTEEAASFERDTEGYEKRMSLADLFNQHLVNNHRP